MDPLHDRPARSDHRADERGLAVAAALDAPVELLAADAPTQGLEVTRLHHRRRHSRMTAVTKKQVEAVTNLTPDHRRGLAARDRLDPGESAPDKYRFTLAHELGHLVVHQWPRESQEEEANRFASELLAPGEEISPMLAGPTTRDSPRLLALKQQWGMSIAALIQRARDLEQISERQYREFQVQLGRLGWKRREPGHLR